MTPPSKAGHGLSTCERDRRSYPGGATELTLNWHTVLASARWKPNTSGAAPCCMISARRGVPDETPFSRQPDGGRDLRHANIPVFAQDRWPLPIRYLRPALDIPDRHHEKWNGSGYPGAGRGANRSPARIFAVVDVWDALTSDRPYRSALSPDVVIAEGSGGQHFDPQVVTAFVALLEHSAGQEALRQ